MRISNKDQFIEIITHQDWLIETLRDVRSLNLPGWYIAAGAIRNTVWNYFHDYPTKSNQNDIDVVYFDLKDMKGNKEKIYEEKLKQINSDLNWEVVNQARAHLFKQSPNFTRTPAKSSCDAIAYWSETPTCIGVRLEDNDSLTICSPHGLTDLMDLVVRPVPKPYQDLFLYRKRIAEKNWNKTWPNLKIFIP